MSDLEHDDESQPAIVEALRELVRSEGFRWLTAQASDMAGPAGYGRQVNAAISAIPPGPNREFEVAAAVEKIHAACEAVNALIKRPQQTLARLTQKKTPRPFEHLRRTLGA